MKSAGFLAGGGELGALCRAHDWLAHPLGAPENWPSSLKVAIRIMLTSRQPIWVGWGRELYTFYNDPYKAIIGGKHPWALGRPTSEVWSEIWPQIGPLLAQAMGGIEGTYSEDQLLIMERNGYPEETYYTFSYSPIPNDDGSVGGIICANTEDTDRVIGERQIALLRDVSAAIIDPRSWREVCENSALALATNPRDFPFALLYMSDDDSGRLKLVATAGIERDHPAAPPLLAFDSAAPWPVASLRSSGDVSVVENLETRFRAPLPSGAWDQPPTRAAIVHIPSGRPGVLIVGLNPFRLFDDRYRDFVGLAAGQIGAGIANAEAYEYERRRAESLADLDRAKTAFFANLSHEFRTPLTLMLGPIEESLAEAATLPPAERERIALVHRNGLRLHKLVNALLDFSRIEAGRMKAIYEPTDLGAFTAELASNFRSATEKAGLDLIIDCPIGAPPVHVDRDMWEKIVLNLLSNAFKFTFEGAIEVSVMQNAGAAELVVRDTGTGVPAHEVPRLFERFHRIEGARGRSHEGSGIGLALVRELVELHGGSIRAESEEGKGTAFFVAIPLGTAHLPREHVRQQASGAPTMRSPIFVEEAIRWLPNAGAAALSIDDDVAPAAGGRARILVADDNADMREYVCRLLSIHHECSTVSDGEAALEQIRVQRPDLLLTDIMMPRLDGFGLIQAIREDPALRDLPVIVLSARAGEEARVEGITSGADDYLVKPFSARELIARVDGALAMARVRRDMEDALREEARTLETLNRVGAAVAAELDLSRAVQTVTDAATELTGAEFGSFFYNVVNDRGESYMLYTLSGVPRDAFSKFPMPRNTEVFAPTFAGSGIVRSDDITTDPRYGHSAPHYGMPKGHLPVRSYLAAPVVSRSGEVLGGLFFGHHERAVFDDRSERILVAIAAQAATAIDNARLYEAAQKEIGERRRTEAALREAEERQQRLNQTLEAKVVERTADLESANRRLLEEADERAKVEFALRQSQKMEAVGKLTGGIAHDFNNLLQVIAGNLQLLTRDVAGNERAEQRIRNAIAGVTRGSKLASQLLAFGRRQPLVPKVVNLGRFVRGLDDLLRRALGDGIEVETVIDGDLWNVLADTSQVENALLNLAINARDAMGGHGKLTIEARNCTLDRPQLGPDADVEPGEYVMLAVTDTGCGMAADVVEHAFEPFFTTKPEGHGTGLGLSMVYGFVKQSGGHIGVHSEVDRGTTFRIYLPRVPQEEDLVGDIDLGPVAGGDETVLVVEDDETVRETVCDLLIDLGYRVLRAKDAQSALVIIESGAPIDLLFTDVVMPGPLRSPELARLARERLPGVAVLFTSGYTDDAIVHGGRVDPGIELLSKPYRREALARKVRLVLHNQAQRNALGAATGLPDIERLRGGRADEALEVLLVEDDDHIRSATAGMLTMLGHAVAEAADAEQALVKLQARHFDVLVTDVSLPGIDGDELAHRARLRWPHLRVVFATGYDSVAVRDPERHPEGVLLRKPYDVGALVAALEASRTSPPSTAPA